MKPRLVWSIFPAFFREFSIAELAEMIRAVGLDTVNAMVREGYWVEPANLEPALAAFVREMATHGVRVDRASTSYSARTLVEHPEILHSLRSAGIREFRMGWFPRPPHGMRAALDAARSDLEALAPLCQAADIKAVYQVHHDKLVQSPTAAYAIVSGLPARWIGVELDPGNQSFEGHESPEYSVDLLGEYLTWFVCKDTHTWQKIPRSEEATKGWHREFCPVYDGAVDWQRHLRALVQGSYTGTMVLMPFYEPNDSIARVANLKHEVDYLKALYETT